MIVYKIREKDTGYYKLPPGKYRGSPVVYQCDRIVRSVVRRLNKEAQDRYGDNIRRWELVHCEINEIKTEDVE